MEIFAVEHLFYFLEIDCDGLMHIDLDLFEVIFCYGSDQTYMMIYKGCGWNAGG